MNSPWFYIHKKKGKDFFPFVVFTYINVWMTLENDLDSLVGMRANLVIFVQPSMMSAVNLGLNPRALFL